MTKLKRLSLWALCLLLALSPAALAAPFNYTPDVVHNSVLLEGLIPVKQFQDIALPQGSIEFDEGTLSVNMIPNWNFDRLPVLQGPILRTEVTTNGREALVSGLVLFTEGYWYDKYWTPGSKETVTTNAGTTFTGKISNLTDTSISITSGGTTTTIPLADVKELHSPRAYVFAVPALAAGPVTPDVSWTADVRTVSLAATVAPGAGGPVLANVRRDPLLSTKDEGDWSNRKMIIVGTALSLINLAQFTPAIILPQFSHQLWQHNNKKSFYTQTHGVPAVPAPLLGNGNTYSLPIPGNATH